jgi:hypothetical protein
MVNNAIIETAQRFDFKGTYRSHSFRIARINNLLKEFPLTTVALQIGHKNIESTYIYARLLENEKDLEKLDKLDEFNEVL